MCFLESKKTIGLLLLCLIISLSNYSVQSEQTESWKIKPPDKVTMKPSSLFASVGFSEVFYDTPGNENIEEWIELYNNDTVSVDISGWVLKDEDDTHVFIIPTYTVISAGDYFVLCRDSAMFHGMFSDVNTPLPIWEVDAMNRQGKII